MNAKKTPISLELCHHNVVKETYSCGVDEAKELLAKRLDNGYRWQIAPPDSTGNLPDDEARYNADYAACGIDDVCWS